MTPAEFRCKREYLGLSMAWIARALNASERSVRRWEQVGHGDVPTRAAELINQLYAGAAKSVSVLTVAQMKRRDRMGEAWKSVAIPVPLNDPAGEFPGSWFRMIAVRVAERTGQPLSYDK